MPSPDEIESAKRRLRARGWFVRTTEWPSGHQVVLHLRADTAVHLVTGWCPTEAGAFEEALALAAEHERRTGVPGPAAGAPRPETDGGDASAGERRELDLVLLGDAHEELAIRMPRLPAVGESLPGDLFLRRPGGKGARQALAAARLEGSVALVARVGTDRVGDEIVARLRDEGVEIGHVVRDAEAPTGIALVHLDRHGRRSRAVLARPAKARLSLEDVRAAEDAMARASVVVASLEVSPACVAEAVRIARRRGAQVVLDVAPPGKPTRDVLGLVDVAVVASRDAGPVVGAAVKGRRSALLAARSLLRRGPGAVVLRGPRTTLLLTRSDEIWIPVPSASSRETPESADAFCSALALALARGLDLARAAQLASAAAAIAASRSGESAPLPTRSEVDDLARQAPRAEELVLDGIAPADAPREAPGHPPE